MDSDAKEMSIRGLWIFNPNGGHKLLFSRLVSLLGVVMTRLLFAVGRFDGTTIVDLYFFYVAVVMLDSVVEERSRRCTEADEELYQR